MQVSSICIHAVRIQAQSMKSIQSKNFFFHLISLLCVRQQHYNQSMYTKSQHPNSKLHLSSRISVRVLVWPGNLSSIYPHIFKWNIGDFYKCAINTNINYKTDNLTNEFESTGKTSHSFNFTCSLNTFEAIKLFLSLGLLGFRLS